MSEITDEDSRKIMHLAKNVYIKEGRDAAKFEIEILLLIEFSSTLSENNLENLLDIINPTNTEKIAFHFGDL